MKLFKPVLYWLEAGSLRRFSLKIAGTEDFCMEAYYDHATKESGSNVVPHVSDDMPEEDVPAQLELLSAVSAVLDRPLRTWLSTSDQDTKDYCIAAVESVLTELVRSIENTPRSAESTLEMCVRAYVSGVPIQLAPFLFHEEVSKELVEPMSELEKQFSVDTVGMEPSAALRMMLERMPPPTYQIMHPAVSEDIRKKFTTYMAQQLAAQGVSQGPMQ